MSDQADANFLMVYTGVDLTGRTDIKTAIAERFKIIRPKLVPITSHRDWSQQGVYTGSRCKPENIGWRMIQNLKLGFHGRKLDPATVTVDGINEGVYDKDIEDAWHEAARAEYWYLNEKGWED